MMSDALLTESYNYELPPHLIAKYPVEPRDSAKLLVYNRVNDSITHTIFRNLLDFIPKDTNVFLNDTKVIKARLFGRKETGGKVELLFNRALDAFNFLVLIKGRVRENIEIFFSDNLIARVVELRDNGLRVVRFTHRGIPIRFEELVTILDRIGHVPLPPYIDREDNIDDEKSYQTIFAKYAGAVAAPTASLHFTPELFNRLEERFNTYRLTLHIGAGTFKPVETESILNHQMHEEYFSIPEESATILKGSKKILAIGTTVTRTVEYFARTGKLHGECDLFLNPLNKPIRVNHLLTNFHLPKSTLIMLVAAFIGREKTLELYQEAIERDYRFFSYGDAMLIM